MTKDMVGGHGKEDMDSSERVSWEDCPICHRSAAVGWRNGQPVEFDCPRGCQPSSEQVRAYARGRSADG